MNIYIIGLIVVVGLLVTSFIIKAIKQKQKQRYFEEDIAWQLSKAREMGIPLDNIKFDNSNNLLNPNTGNPILY